MSNPQFRTLTDDLQRIIEHLETSLDASTPEPALHTLAMENEQAGRLTNLLAGLYQRSRFDSDLEANGLQALTRIMDGTGHGYWLWDLRSNNAQFSPGWAQMTGLRQTAGHSGLEPWLMHVQSEHRDLLLTAIRDHLDGHAAQIIVDYRLVCGDGSKRWMRCRAMCERDANGTPLVIAGTQRDITDEINTDTTTGFLNEHGFIETIDDIYADGSDPCVVLIEPQCNRCTLDKLDLDVRKTFRSAFVRRMTTALPGGAHIGELPGHLFGIAFAGDSNIDIDETLETVAAQILRGVRGVDDSLVADFLIDATVGGAAGSRCVPFRAEGVIGAALASLRESVNNASNETMNLQQLAGDRAGCTSATVTMIRRALSENCIVPFFQPIVSVDDGELVGFEALVRLQHPSRGVLSPSEFLSTAERSDQIIEIGEVMLHKALQTLAAAQSTGKLSRETVISVNISGRQLCDERLPAVIRRALETAGLPPSCLRIELTETTLVSNLSFARRTLNKLRRQGIRVALDDFGAGYSSLAYLQELPIDVLKIDRSFVRNVHQNQSRSAILSTITSLSTLLNVPVIAEGVECQAEVEALQQLGVKYAQGYHYAKPAPMSVHLAMMAEKDHEEQDKRVKQL